MAKATSQWRNLMNSVETLPLADLATETLRLLPLQRRSGRRLLMLAGAIALFCWNGRLVMATGTGVGVMLLIYVLHDWKLTVPWSALQKRLEGWNQPVTLAIAGGGLACLTTYLAASIWADSESGWIAIGALLQGTGTLAVLILLSWQVLNQSHDRDRGLSTTLIADLTHADPLRRLIAVRTLISTSDAHPCPRQCQELSDYFRLMLQREPEPIVRDAVFDGLQILDQSQPIPQPLQPATRTPLTAFLKSATPKRQAIKSRDRVSVP